MKCHYPAQDIYNLIDFTPGFSTSNHSSMFILDVGGCSQLHTNTIPQSSTGAQMVAWPALGMYKFSDFPQFESKYRIAGDYCIDNANEYRICLTIQHN
jgi:hypothetical protein